MAVLVEGISVVIRSDRLLAAFGGDWDAVRAVVPNETLCGDDELARAGFSTHAEAETLVDRLAASGLIYVEDGAARDLVIVDQRRGPLVRCDWIEFGQATLDGDPAKRVSACRLRGSTRPVTVTPEGWTFDGSLSARLPPAPEQRGVDRLAFVGSQGGYNIYRDRASGSHLFVSSAEWGGRT